MQSIIFENKKVVPNKIVCIGRNYVEHIKELDNEIPTEPVIFIKPNSAISEKLRFFSDDNHYEAEISFLIKNGVIYGVGLGLDITKRDLQKKLKEKSLPWERAKAFDGSAVFSDFVKFDGEIEKLSLELYLNNKLVQKGGVKLMIYKPDTILKDIKTFLTLDDFDIVMSGTPKGVGKYKKGDDLRGAILYDNREIVSKRWKVI